MMAKMCAISWRNPEYCNLVAGTEHLGTCNHPCLYNSQIPRTKHARKHKSRIWFLNIPLKGHQKRKSVPAIPTCSNKWSISSIAKPILTKHHWFQYQPRQHNPKPNHPLLETAPKHPTETRSLCSSFWKIETTGTYPHPTKIRARKPRSLAARKRWRWRVLEMAISASIGLVGAGDPLCIR